MKNARGFSIIELVIAVSLASFVLVGVATIAAQMARTQLDGVRTGTMTGWSVVSYMAMSKEIEEGNVLAFPIADGSSSDNLIICKNWSRMMGSLPGGRLDTNSPVSVIQYCVDSSDTSNLVMRRYANVGVGVSCPNPGSPVTCSASPPGTWTETGIVGIRLEKISGGPSTVFLRDNAIGGVRLRYVIGRQTATTNDPNPRSTAFNFGISMQKQYNSTLD